MKNLPTVPMMQKLFIVKNELRCVYRSVETMKTLPKVQAIQKFFIFKNE